MALLHERGPSLDRVVRGRRDRAVVADVHVGARRQRLDVLPRRRGPVVRRELEHAAVVGGVAEVLEAERVVEAQERRRPLRQLDAAVHEQNALAECGRIRTE